LKIIENVLLLLKCPGLENFDTSENYKLCSNTVKKSNQLAIESLVLSIMKNESSGLKDFFEANMPQEKSLRSASQGKLNPPLLRQTGHSFKEQAIIVWNDLDVKAS
jgi:hypothetical protein